MWTSLKPVEIPWLISLVPVTTAVFVVIVGSNGVGGIHHDEYGDSSISPQTRSKVGFLCLYLFVFLHNT